MQADYKVGFVIWLEHHITFSRLNAAVGLILVTYSIPLNATLYFYVTLRLVLIGPVLLLKAPDTGVLKYKSSVIDELMRCCTFLDSFIFYLPTF